MAISQKQIKNNHFSTVAEAEVAGALGDHCYVQETDTFYVAKTSSESVDDTHYIDALASGVQWVGISGKYSTVTAETSSLTGYTYVPRPNRSDWDFELADFTTDGGVYSLDVSSIVPSNAKAVSIRAMVRCSSTTNGFLAFYPSSTAPSTRYDFRVFCPEVNQITDNVGVATLDSLKLYYETWSATYNLMSLEITGWFIEDSSGQGSADLSNYYTKAEVDYALNDYLTLVDLDAVLNTYYTSDEIDYLLNDYYTSSEVDSLLSSVESIPDAKLLNPSFNIWQRGDSFTASGFTADEWKLALNSSTVTIEKEEEDDCGNPGNQKFGDACMKITLSSLSSAATLTQGYEEYWGLAGYTMTFSAWVKCSSASCIRLQILDYNGSTLEVQSGSYHTGGGDWEQLTVTKTLRSSLEGTSDIPHSFGVGFRISIEATCTGALVDGGTLAFGSSAIDYHPTRMAEDILRCQRFCQAVHVAISQYWNPAIGFGPLNETAFKVKMYATPTITFSINYHNENTITNSSPYICAFGTTTEGFSKNPNLSGSTGYFQVDADAIAEVA